MYEKLAYFYGLEAAQKAYPEGKGEKGDCFINGETASIWIWNPFIQRWDDTNRPLQSPLCGVIDGNPVTYEPTIQAGIPALYIYKETSHGQYEMTNFRNNNEPIQIFMQHPGEAWLFWNGDQWSCHIYYY